MKKEIHGISIFVAIVCSLGGFLFGYTTSVISGVLDFISKEFSFSIYQQGLVVSILILGCIAGAWTGGLLSDNLGRKVTLFITTLLFFVGTIILTMSNTFLTLLLGRVLSGIGVGIVSVVVPMYIAEMSPAHLRGTLVSFNQLAITLGILSAYVIDYSLAQDSAWRAMFGFAFVPNLVFFLGLFFIPESPTWLAEHGKIEKARQILQKVHKLKYKEEEILVETKQKTGQKLMSWKHFFDKGMKPALIVGIGISIFQQVTGINAVIYYAPQIFQLAKFSSAETALLATVGIGIINVIMTIVALWLIDKVGRKPLLIVGISGMVVCLAVLGLAFFFSLMFVNVISLICLMGFVAFFAISLGPIAWLLIAEIFPMGIRGRAMGLASFANWGFNYLISLTFLWLIGILGQGATFWLFAIMGVFALWFVYKKVPETKNKSFEKIQAFWKK